MKYEILEQLYEGKAKRVYKTNNSEVFYIEYKDDATAFNALKKGTIENKGIVNNLMSNKMFQILEKAGIRTHLIENVDDRHTFVKAVEIVQVEVIVRNIATGSLTKRLGIKDGTILEPTILEFCLKSDALGDPIINEYHVKAMKLATDNEILQIKDMTFKINDILKAQMDKLDLTLVDFKIEFGRYRGNIILADEISPDTCRLWDKKTNERMDKDRFRLDLGNEKATYQEVMRRVNTLTV